MKFLTLEQFKEMWELQDSLNTATSGPDWKKKNQNWNLAIKAEVMEFFDYIGWKWWKEPEKTRSCMDLQARLELVDIWHFLLSSLIEGSQSGQAKNCYIDLSENMEEYSDALKASVFHLGHLDSITLNNYSKVERLEAVLKACGWTWNDLYVWYLAKNVLNKFRQDHGYKEGMYHKEWTISDSRDFIQREDNYFMAELVHQLVNQGNYSARSLYSGLHNLYVASKENLANL